MPPARPSPVRAYLKLLALSAFLAVGVVACQQTSGSASDPVSSILEGRITVSPEVDSIQDYRGFEVVVVQAQGRRVDTLGYAITDSTGQFQATVSAGERGVYPLLIRRRGRTLARAELVVAHEDTASFSIEFPAGNRMLRIRSDENAAWVGYRNTMALHRQTIIRNLQNAQFGREEMERSVSQTSTILWSIHRSYPNTLAADYAAVESIALVEGWDDSLAVARARGIEPGNPRYVEAARLARRAQARLNGQGAAVDLLNQFISEAETPEQRAALQAEVVRTRIDSVQRQEALAAARALKSQHAQSEWAAWADRAIYEIENLLPGQPAPGFTAQTVSGRTLALDSLRGRPIVLEFYRPESDIFQQQLSMRNALYEATRTDSLAFVSISLEPDTLLNEAFFEGRSIPGTHIIASDSSDESLTELYNIATTPTRYLIDPNGDIVGKYVGAAFVRMQEDLTRLLDTEGIAVDGDPPTG